MSTKPRYTYTEAAQAMQAGVNADLALGDQDLTPKNLRVGVNSALVDSTSLAKLLISKGLITEAEYLTAITQEMNDEVERYEKHLSARTGRIVTLRPGVVDMVDPNTLKGKSS